MKFPCILIVLYTYHMIELIIKKRNGFELNKKEYKTIIDGFLSGKIPDYQVSAFLMKRGQSLANSISWNTNKNTIPIKIATATGMATDNTLINWSFFLFASIVFIRWYRYFLTL